MLQVVKVAGRTCKGCTSSKDYLREALRISVFRPPTLAARKPPASRPSSSHAPTFEERQAFGTLSMGMGGAMGLLCAGLGIALWSTRAQVRNGEKQHQMLTRQHVAQHRTQVKQLQDQLQDWRNQAESGRRYVTVSGRVGTMAYINGRYESLATRLNGYRVYVQLRAPGGTSTLGMWHGTGRWYIDPMA